jgi:hypothetical protein
LETGNLESILPVKMLSLGRSLKGPNQYFNYFDRINRIFRIIVFTLSRRKRERTIPLPQEKIKQFIR